jgi:hypothetical protein
MGNKNHNDCRRILALQVKQKGRTSATGRLLALLPRDSAGGSDGLGVSWFVRRCLGASFCAWLSGRMLEVLVLRLVVELGV